MYFAKESEYNDIREKSFLQHYLKDENEKLREENELKNSYLKKMKMRE